MYVPDVRWAASAIVYVPEAQAASDPGMAQSAPRDLVALFVRGYQDAGGPFDRLPQFLDCVIPAESGWNPRADNGLHRGLTQFSQATWEAMMEEPYFDGVFDPYLHGVAVARLANYVETTPGSTYAGQWSTFAGC